MRLEVLRTSGEERTQVFSGGGEITHPKWGPDSDRLAYALAQESGNAVYVSDSEGEESVLLSKVAADEVGGWSPEGDFVVFSVRDGAEQGLYVRNPEGVNEFRRTQSPDYGAVWSHDSRYIAFLSTRDGNSEIYVVDPEEGEEIRVTDSEAPEYDLSWSPNGKRLLFVTERDGNAEIYVVEIKDRGMPDNLTRLTHNELRDEQPTWSPNRQENRLRVIPRRRRRDIRHGVRRPGPAAADEQSVPGHRTFLVIPARAIGVTCVSARSA